MKNVENKIRIRVFHRWFQHVCCADSQRLLRKNDRRKKISEYLEVFHLRHRFRGGGGASALAGALEMPWTDGSKSDGRKRKNTQK